MLAKYEGFPGMIHGKALLEHNSPIKTLAKVVLRVLSDLNKVVLETDAARFPVPPNCEIRFEWGVSYGDSFVYLDVEETAKAERLLEDTVPSVLDFYFVVLYHRITSSKRVPLKFDYGFLRVLIAENKMEMFASHEKGPMRFPIGELLSFLAERINKELVGSREGELHLKEIRAV